MHLSELKTGEFNEGDIIGKTGNSGTLTKSPHLHIDISQGSVEINNFNNFIDPEKYDWGEEENMPFNDQEVREMIRANVRVWGEHEPTEDEINGHLAAIKERQKEPNDWALSEYEIDRHKEFSPKYVSVEENDRLKEQMQGALIRIDEQTKIITDKDKSIEEKSGLYETCQKDLKTCKADKTITYKCDFWSIIKSIFKKGTK